MLDNLPATSAPARTLAEFACGLTFEHTCAIDPESAFPTFFSGGVRLHLRDGRTLYRHVRVNSGAGERALDTDGISRKFLASATLVIPRDNAERIRDAVLTLENHTAAHLASLLRSEAPSPGSEKHS